MREDGAFYRSMFDLSRALFSQRTTDGVLRQIVTALQAHFPFAATHLYMSQETTSSDIPSLSLFFRHDGNDLRTQAFMSGKPKRSANGLSDRSGCSAAAVPLIGKQGVYGVLEARSEQRPLLPQDMDMLTTIGETGGTAFENARLYEQSNLMITELRLINEITRRLNQSFREPELFQYACNELIQVFHADCAGILQYNRAEHVFVVKATNITEWLNETIAAGCGYIGRLIETREPIIVSDCKHHDDAESKLMRMMGARSLIAAPILIDGEVAGAIMIANKAPHFFTYENYKLLHVLAGHIGLAIMKAHLHAALNRMVITDNLTGLYARRYLDEQVHAHQEKDVRGSLIVVDIDNFKQVNDSFGHQVGDRILKQVSGIIRSCIRDTDIAARWGGEELAIYLPQLRMEQAELVAERMRSRVERETDPKVTVSCGIAEWSRDDEKVSVESLFYKADMALYSAKHNGKNQYCKS